MNQQKIYIMKIKNLYVHFPNNKINFKKHQVSYKMLAIEPKLNPLRKLNKNNYLNRIKDKFQNQYNSHYLDLTVNNKEDQHNLNNNKK